MVFVLKLLDHLNCHLGAFAAGSAVFRVLQRFQ